MIADALLPLLPGRITQLQHRLGLPGVSRRQIRGAVLTLVRLGKARYFRGRVVSTMEIAMTIKDNRQAAGVCCGAAEPPCPDFPASCENPANYPDEQAALAKWYARRMQAIRELAAPTDPNDPMEAALRGGYEES